MTTRNGNEPEALLEVKGLKTYFYTEDGVVQAINGVDFRIRPGEIMGLVGESGSGKSVTSLSIMRLLPASGQIVEGEVHFAGRDLAHASEADLVKIRGNEIAMIFQQPTSCLNPVFRIGDQIAEVLIIHKNLSHAQAWQQAIELLRKVGIPSAERRVSAFPHEVSGGQAQRVMIAMALASQPKLLIADEPTTALDATIQSQIVDLLVDLTRRHGTSLLLVTHNIALVAEIADQVAVMYGGTMVEIGPKDRVLDAPRHPYTAALVDSIPRLDEPDRPLHPIPGMMPGLAGLPEGCPFHPRCALARLPDCRVRPALVETAPGHCVACHFALEPSG